MVARMKHTADSDLAPEVLSRIRQVPKLRETDVTVAVDRGVVTLTGLVKTEAERTAIEAAARKVPGVEAIASNLLVKPTRERSDEDIARAALNALHNHVLIPASNITVIVRDGSVTLEGQVHSSLQSMLAEAEIKRLRGIETISNRLAVTPEATDTELESSLTDNGNFSNDSAWVETGEAEAG
jgi:osmotically-inducible protein OsmY